MLGELEPTNSPGKLRNYAIIRLFLNTGLRAHELAGLTLRNLDLSTGRVKVRGKGGKDRVLWLSDADVALVKVWLEKRRPSGDLVFTSLDGKRPICQRWLRDMVKRVAGRAGIGKDIHPTLSVILSPRTFCAGPKIYVWCRRLWVTPTSPPPRSTRISWTRSLRRPLRSYGNEN